MNEQLAALSLELFDQFEALIEIISNGLDASNELVFSDVLWG
jgi:hypothetical protein